MTPYRCHPATPLSFCHAARRPAGKYAGGPGRAIAAAVLFLLALAPPAGAATRFGPWHASFIAGGVGIPHPVAADAPFLRADAPFTMTLWFDGSTRPGAPALLASIGAPAQPEARRVGIDARGRLFFASGDARLAAPRPLRPGPHFVALRYDGRTASLFLDGRLAASGTMALTAVGVPPPAMHWEENAKLPPRVDIAPAQPELPDNSHFAGRIADMRIDDGALDDATLATMARTPPDWERLSYDRADKPWPVQLRQQAGNRSPQPPETLPVSREAPGRPVAKPLPDATPLKPRGPASWTLAGGWRLAAAPDVAGDGATLSRPGAVLSGPWHVATVPGTVLTTLVDRGVYPEPSHGLDNLTIPESLARQDYWYRTEFATPADARRWTLTFEGINYAAEVWLNGTRLGDIKGAFIRGRFDVSPLLATGGRNALAVRISPPPHPGIPTEESPRAGPGENGGIMLLDGPTFVASEGWDWIPAIRDRNSGIWQDVVLDASGTVRIGDPRIVTRLPRPDNSIAELSVTVPLDNPGAATRMTVSAAFDDVRVSKSVDVPTGASRVAFTPAEFPALVVRDPRLWWPNGYGEPALHAMHIAVADAGGVSDQRDIRFGMREISYEMSAFDAGGALRRVALTPDRADGTPLLAVDHDHIHETPRAWAVSLANGDAKARPGLAPLPEDPLSPFLVVRVNGVRIAIRGGAWGTDEMMKRVSRARLEPYFRLERDAHMNLIRNWVGQNTEAVFYDLADEYGLLVWNDFWESTQDYNLEAADPALFLANARDVIARFRNHPSILVWVPRNEGVPQPGLNESLDALVREEDGTRLYLPTSNIVNLQVSGPYTWREPAGYFDRYSKGFAVEVGTASFTTIDAFKAAIAPADQWPMSDAWTYHDWHLDELRDAKLFMRAMDAKLGPSTSLETFEKRAQLLNYDSYRAIFEGLNAGLWTRNSGRILWMTHPSWPSNMWQIHASDYDTNAAYYGARLASERLHVQLNQDDHRLAVINLTLAPANGLTVEAAIHALDGRLLDRRTARLDAAANATTPSFLLPVDRYDQTAPVLVRLMLRDAAGRLLSRNMYWQAGSDAATRPLAAMPPADVTARLTRADDRLVLALANGGSVPALLAKATLLDRAGARVLPAYYSDNYVSLLAGETAEIVIEAPALAAADHVRLNGWNMADRIVPVER
jgi:hypothetical protein